MSVPKIVEIMYEIYQALISKRQLCNLKTCVERKVNNASGFNMCQTNSHVTSKHYETNELPKFLSYGAPLHFYTGRLCPEVLTLTLLYTILAEYM